MFKNPEAMSPAPNCKGINKLEKVPDIIERVVNHSIAVGCGRNETGLRIDDFEGMVFAGAISLVNQFFLELEKFGF